MKTTGSHYHRNLGLSVLAMSIQLATISPLYALPTGAQVVHGGVEIQQQAADMAIRQSTDQAIVNYEDFSIQAGERVNIQQPNAQSVLLNRVLPGGNVSQIHGALQANGQVFLVNPAGIVMGDAAKVNVNGLVLTTHDISDESFLSNLWQFEASQDSLIQISGDIQVEPGGFVIILSQAIEMEGHILAQFGQVSMVAADGASFKVEPGHWPQLQVTQATYDAWLHQNGLIEAEGGLVTLTADSASDLVDRVIFHEGTTNTATTNTATHPDTGAKVGGGGLEVVKADGAVYLKAQGKGYIQHTGEITTDGGAVDIAAEAIRLDHGSQITTDSTQAKQAAGEVKVIGEHASLEAGASISAQGKAQKADGGFVEVSGYQWVGVDGDVNTSAVDGQQGSLLIDPYNITINTTNSGSVNTSDSPPDDDSVYSPSSGGATIDVGRITSLLDDNDVTISTTNPNGTGSEDGRITLSTALDLQAVAADTGETPKSLTLLADSDINLNANISDITEAGSISLIMQAGQDINLAPGRQINIANGDVTFNAQEDIKMGLGSSINSGLGGINLTTNTGNIDIALLTSRAEDTDAVTINAGGLLRDVFDGTDQLNINLTGDNARANLTSGDIIELLEIQVPILTAQADTLRGFSQQTGDLLINSITAERMSSGTIDIQTLDGDIIIQAANGNPSPAISVTDSNGGMGNVSLSAQGVNRNINLADTARILTQSGNINLQATGGISMASNAQITSNIGKIITQSGFDQSLALISTNSTDDAAITLEANNSSDILDAQGDETIELNLSAPLGGLDLVNVDNFAGLETNLDRFTANQGFAISQISFNEVDDIEILSLLGTATGVDIDARGTLSIDAIATGGLVALSAANISDTSDNDILNIRGSSIELTTDNNIGDVNNSGLTVADYLEVDTANLTVNLLNEGTALNSNEIAIRQISGSSVGDLIINRLETPDQPGVAKIFFASKNNGIDISQAEALNIDNSDILGLSLSNSDNDLDGPGIEFITLPSLNQVGQWSLGGLVLNASGDAQDIQTRETNDVLQTLNNWQVSADQLVLRTNHSHTINFTGSRLDAYTSTGDFTIASNGALQVLDLDNNDQAFVTENGNLALSAQGNLELSDQILATDPVNDNIRAGLIDISTNKGNIQIGQESVVITSTNTQDSDEAGGLGNGVGGSVGSTNDQVAISIRQTAQKGPAAINIGRTPADAEPPVSVAINAVGGDLVIGSGELATSRDVSERTLLINGNSTIQSRNSPDDPPTGTELIEEVDFAGESVPVINAFEGRIIRLSSQNVVGFNLDDDSQVIAENAVESAEKVTEIEPEPAQPAPEEPQPDETPMALMLNTVVPNCGQGESTTNSSMCLKKTAFREFLRSMILGRGFPDSIKGLPK